METITRSGLLWDCWIMASGLDFSYQPWILLIYDVTLDYALNPEMHFWALDDLYVTFNWHPDLRSISQTPLNSL